MLSKHCFLTAALGGIVVLGNSSLAAAQTVGPNGEPATPSSALTLTDAEVAKLKEGKYSAALVWHTSSDFISAVTAGAIHEFDRAGIKVVATTDAGFDSARQLSDVETVMAKSPSVILALPLDPIGSAKAFQVAKEKGVELVFLSNVPAGYKQGVDYVSIVTDDLFQMGKQAADALAKSLLNKGKIAWIFHDAQYYVTNQRDNAFRKTVENDYKNMPIVARQGITDPARSEDARGWSADDAIGALFAAHYRGLVRRPLRVDVPRLNGWFGTCRGSPKVATATTWLPMEVLIGAVAVPRLPP